LAARPSSPRMMGCSGYVPAGPSRRRLLHRWANEEICGADEEEPPGPPGVGSAPGGGAPPQPPVNRPIRRETLARSVCQGLLLCKRFCDGRLPVIFGPKSDGTYVIEFRPAAGESLAISILRGWGASSYAVAPYAVAPTSTRRQRRRAACAT